MKVRGLSSPFYHEWHGKPSPRAALPVCNQEQGLRKDVCAEIRTSAIFLVFFGGGRSKREDLRNVHVPLTFVRYRKKLKMVGYRFPDPTNQGPPGASAVWAGPLKGEVLVAREKIMAVDDEEDILELVSYNLTKNGFQVITVSSGEDAVEKARSELPNLILLDLMLPGADGLEVCKILKNDPKTADILILMLTAKGEEADIVTGLELGADDYVTKPFSPRILLARVRALLRRRGHEEGNDSEPVRRGDMSIHPGRHEVRIQEKPVELTHTEFRLLYFLAKRPGWVFTRNQIIDEVHGEDYAVTDRSVDVFVAGLRKKLGEHGTCIETVRGVGYRFKE